MTTPLLPAYRTPGPVNPGVLPYLKKPSYMRRFLSVFPSELPTATAVCATDITDVFTQVSVTDQSDNWNLVKPGMTVHFGLTPGASDGGVYRVRKDPVGSTLYLDENGASAAGLLAQDLKLYNVQDGMYITVDLIDRNVWAALPRITYLGGTDPGTFYRDYDQLWNEQTYTPPPILNLGRHWSTFVQPGTAYQDLFFIPTVHLWPGTGYNAKLEYILPAGATLLTGTLDTGWTLLGGLDTVFTEGIISVRFPPGVHVVQAILKVEKNIGTPGIMQTTAFRYVWCYDGKPGDSGATFTPIRVAEVGGDSRTPDGRSMQFKLNQQDLGLFKSYSMIQYFEEAFWGGVRVADATTSAVGWLVRKQHHTEPRTLSSDLEFVSPMQRLQQLPGNPGRIYHAAGNIPTTWNEVTEENCHAEYAAFHLLRHQAVGFLDLFDYTPQNTNTDAIYRTASISIPRNNIADQVKGTLAKANLVFTCDSNGAFWNRIDPAMQPYTDRGSTKIPERDTLDPSIYQTADLSHEIYLKRRRTKATAFYYDQSTGKDGALAAEIPGGAHGQATEDQEWSGWLVKDQLDLNTRVGQEHHRANNPYTLEVLIPNNRDIYEPAHMSFIRVQIPAAKDPENIARDKRFILNSVQKEHKPGGRAFLRLSLRAETAGQAGNTIIIDPRIKPPPPPPPPPPGPTDGYPWAITFNFLTDDQNWNSAEHGQAEYIPSVGWSSETHGPLCEIATILHNDSATVTTHVLYGEVTYLITTPVAPPSAFTNEITLGGVTSTPVVVGSQVTKPFTLALTIATSNFIGLGARANGYDSGGYGKIVRIRIAGDGVKPRVTRPV